MGPFLMFMLVIAVFAVIVILWFVATYNGLVGLRNRVKEAWAQIDVQLKRRHDLIPNLVETVKGYAGHEKGTLEAVIQARSQAVNAQSIPDKIDAEKNLSGTLGKLMLLVEQYPNLKANQNFMALQEELSSTENKIGFARQYYNETVMQYNTGIQKIPANIVAGFGHFEAEKFFEIEDKSEKEVPQVKF